MPWIEVELNEEFKQWIIDFPKLQLPLIYNLLKLYKNDKKIIIFKSRYEADSFLSNLASL